MDTQRKRDPQSRESGTNRTPYRSVDEVNSDPALSGRWVLMEITEHDEHHLPSQGVLLVASANRQQINKVLARQPLRSELPPERAHHPFYIFHAEPRSRSGPEFGQAAEELVKRIEKSVRGQSAEHRPVATLGVRQVLSHCP